MPRVSSLFSPLTTVTRLVLSGVLVVLVGLGLFWPLLGQSDGDSSTSVDTASTITDYTADYRVEADGRVYATEALTVELAPQRHGIFRFFPADDPTDPHARRLPTVTAVRMDGQPVPVHYEWRNARTMYVARIGDPEHVAPAGPHRYEISYTFDGGLVPTPEAAGQFTAHAGQPSPEPTASFYYDVVGFWAMPIRTATATLHLPTRSALVQCAADTSGQIPCAITGAGTDEVTVSASALPPQNPVTVRADVVTAPPPRALTLPWTIRFDTILGHSVAAVAVVALLTLLAGAGGWWWARRSREDAPGAPVLYTPPDGLGPAQTAYIVNETPGENALVATVLHMAERHLVRLDGDDPKHWTITGIADAAQWEGVDAVTALVGHALGVDTVEGSLSVDGGVDAGEKLAAAGKNLTSGCRSWSRSEKLMRTAVAEWVGKILVVLCLVLAFLGFTGVAGSTMWGLPFAVFAIAGLGLLSVTAGSRRTRAGRDMWSRAAGFRRLLATPSAEDRFDYAARQDLFIAYIPYAVAFGVADAWAAKYRTATGVEPPTPIWYPVSATPGGSAVPLYAAGGLAGFSAAVGAAIGAYNSSRSSSSGGGGFSGGGGGFGGGGGGGGGTW
ncbi:hypothetical protein BHQ15_00840 [Mycolicibacillus koreensis]|nr:hypothetical protein BHQ15_00840 [Mycolicibacillus koreensis]